METYDPHQLRSSVMAYRNLPDVESVNQCHRLMKNVSRGLRDIIRYLNHTISSLESTYAALKLRVNNKRVSKYIADTHKNAVWVHIIDRDTDARESWKKSFREGIQLLSPSEVINTGSFRERIPRDMPKELRKEIFRNGEESRFTGYPIEVLDYQESRNLLLISNLPELIQNNQKKSFWLLYIPSTYQWGRYLEALHNFINEPPKNLQPLLNLFQEVEYVTWPKLPEPQIREEDWLFLTNRENPSTMKQRHFVRKALNTPDFALLWGPPGSGKTYTIMELIYQAAKRGLRVLFCASTHVAIDQAIERLLKDEKAKKFVVPLRIGESEKISTTIQDYQLERIAPKYRQDIADELSRLPNRTESQDYWLQTLNSDEGKEWFKRMMVDSANLVCGTTVGILQHPEIRDSKSGTNPVYDILIIDEASKTTFHEFLVPAQFAKRWVLCGDPRQLSPFVDQESIAATVRTLLEQEVERECCLDIYSVSNQVRQPIQLLLISDDESVRNLYRKQAEGKGLCVAVIKRGEDFVDIDVMTKILASSVIICDVAQAQSLSKNLPGSIELIRGDMNLLGPVFQAKRNHFLNQKKLWREKESEWEHVLSVILGLEFFTRNTKDGSFERYGEKKLLLCPEFLVDDEVDDDTEPPAQKFDRLLNRIRLCAYPSVLELLVDGFRPNPDFRSTLNLGFSDNDKKERLVELQYQFRMHPEISDFPRRNIYESELLKDAPEIELERYWTYKKYNQRSQWIDVQGECIDDTNQGEARIVSNRLSHFVNWTATNPREDGRPWEVAVLSFYNNQVDLLHRTIRKNTNLEFLGSGLYKSKNVDVRVGSVDSIQGREADIVFISFVRNLDSGFGFLNSPNRLNVAITRARYQLVLVGNKSDFAKQNSSELLHNLAGLRDDTPIGDGV